MTIECAQCPWTKVIEESKAEQSLVGHIGYAHRQGQGSKGKTEHTNSAGERVVNYGRTKRSRENSLRLSDGKVHPVTTRRINSQPDGPDSRPLRSASLPGIVPNVYPDAPEF